VAARVSLEEMLETAFITSLDAAVETHLDWTRRVLRCAVLQEPPEGDMLAPLAHTLCRFGRWFESNRAHFEACDAEHTRRLEEVHQAMHDAIRSICSDVQAGGPGQRADMERFERTQSELIRLLAEFKTRFVALAVRHDPLTGLPLRHDIEGDFIQIRKSCRRDNTLLYAVMIDVDQFKRINDRHGHPVGDAALRHIADTLKRSVRPDEPLYRFGGEEFLLLMQCRTPEAAIAPMQRILQAVRSAPVVMPHGDPLALTVTMGVARAGDDEALGSVVERADRAMYRGKAAGRDCYVFADD